jgi:ATP-dependent DNA helicase RecQ
LHTKRPALVISPLISLMQDQVHKLNGLSDTDGGTKNLATYLGSGQLDPMEETRALRGEYLLVYITPEKLLSNGFLDRLARLNLCVIAVDESHCVRCVWSEVDKPSPLPPVQTNHKWQNCPVASILRRLSL